MTIPRNLSILAEGASSTGVLALTNGGTGAITATAAFNALSPVTSTGDLIIGNGSNSSTRLAIGTSGYVLTSNGTTASWAAVSATNATNISGGATGSVPYQSGASTTVFLAGTTSTTPSFYTSTGTGSAAQAPTLTSSTGTGSVVLATSPSLTTPVLGTPASGNLSNCTADGTNSVGFLNIPQNAQTGAYTTVLSDSGKNIFHATGASAATYTIAANASVAYPLGTAITFINMATAAVTIAINSDTMYLASSGTTGSRTLAQYGVATATKITTTSWIISGVALT